MAKAYDGEMLDTSRARYVEAAKRHAMANLSDPHAFNRSISHLNFGIVGYVDRQGEMVDALYDATEYPETRKLPDGREYVVMVHKNVVRP